MAELNVVAVREVLIASRWMIKKFGWCKISLHDPDAFACDNIRHFRSFHILDALDYCAVRKRTRHQWASYQARQLLIVLTNGNLFQWESHPATLQSNVIELLDKAISICPVHRRFQ